MRHSGILLLTSLPISGFRIAASGLGKVVAVLRVVAELGEATVDLRDLTLRDGATA